MRYSLGSAEFMQIFDFDPEKCLDESRFVPTKTTLAVRMLFITQRNVKLRM